MPYVSSSGKHCVVIAYKNNQKKLYKWRNSECSENNNMTHQDCPCLGPFAQLTIPRNKELRLQWIKSINRKGFKPSSTAVVCSIHFVGGRSTKENSVPTLNMGYQAVSATPARRPPPVRKSSNLQTPSKSTLQPVNSDTTFDELFVATPLPAEPSQTSKCCCFSPTRCSNKPTLVDGSTQTIDVIAVDHNYGYTKKTRNVSCQQTSSDFSVENVNSDSEARFYTGLSASVVFIF